MTIDFRTTTMAELIDGVASRSTSARELTDAALQRIEAVNDKVNAFVAVDADAARAQADHIDRRIAAGEAVGPLAGIPLGVKDLEDAAGFTTSHGSAIWAHDPPATSDSTLVGRLRAAGCVIIGKTNTPELGWKGDTENPTFGATHNPWSLERSAGGSSGGSAAAVVSGMVPLATGSDGGGSIRIPAAICGLTGFKPSLGRVPSGGSHPPDWPDLSTRGVMAFRIRDVALALDAVTGPEPTDLRSLPMPDVPWRKSLDDVGAPLRVGWSPTLGYAPVDPEVRDICQRAVAKLADAGSEVVEVDTVFAEDPMHEWLLLASTYNLRTLEPYIDTDVPASIDPQLVELVRWAKEHVSALDVVKAQDSAHHRNAELNEVLHRVHLLLTPVCAGQTPVIGGQGTIAGVGDANWVRFTYPFNLTRSPAGAVTAGFTADGMPVGLQVVGPQHGDVAVLRLLTFFEDLLGLDRVPPLP